MLKKLFFVVLAATALSNATTYFDITKNVSISNNEQTVTYQAKALEGGSITCSICKNLITLECKCSGFKTEVDPSSDRVFGKAPESSDFRELATQYEAQESLKNKKK